MTATPLTIVTSDTITAASGRCPTAVAAYLTERDGDLTTAARLYVEAARKAPDLAERDHLTRQAARLNARR